MNVLAKNILPSVIALITFASMNFAQVARAEDAAGAESTAEISSQSGAESSAAGDDSVLVAMAPEGVLALMATGGVLLTTAFSLHQWAQHQTKQHYQTAAIELRSLMARGLKNPISRGSDNVKAVAAVQSSFLKKQSYQKSMTETQMAAVIILQADRLAKNAS